MTKCLFYQWCKNEVSEDDDSQVCEQCKIEQGY